MIKTEFVRLYKSVHTWTGILSGMALFIAFYAGALTVFKEPLARWATPPAMTAPLPLDQAQTLITKTLRTDPSIAKDFTIRLHDLENVTARMDWQVRDAAADDHDESSIRHFVATLDRHGDAQISAAYPSTLGGFVDVLHRVVGLPFDNDPNRWVMGVIAALYTVALISGVVVLLPSLVKDFFALRVGKNLKRMWLDAHNVVGIVSLPFHIVMALSAVVFAFHDQVYYVQDKLVHDGQWAATFQRPRADPNAAPQRDPSTMLSPQQLLDKVQSLAPSFVPTAIAYQQVTGARPLVRVWGKDETGVSPRARGGFVAIDPYSGKVVNTDYLSGQQSTPNLFISSFFALHMGSFGGVAVQWMYFILGLAGAWLFYSGNLLWVESRRRRQTKRDPSAPAQRLDTRVMAALTVGVCLGSVGGVSAIIVASKLLHGRVADLAAALPIVYYVVFFGSVGWALLRGSALSAIHLSWAAVVWTATIPLTSLVGALFPQSGLWAHASTACLAVDATALLGALGLVAIARATARRVRHGNPDSVWSQTEVGRQKPPVASAHPLGQRAARQKRRQRLTGSAAVGHCSGRTQRMIADFRQKTTNRTRTSTSRSGS